MKIMGFFKSLAEAVSVFSGACAVGVADVVETLLAEVPAPGTAAIPAGTEVASAAASAANRRLISLITVIRRTRPTPVGSIP